jgi:hypothetical protein
MTRPGPCIRGSHRFSPLSGWCDHGCGWRDDGQSSYLPHTITPTPLAEVIDITEPRRNQHP